MSKLMRFAVMGCFCLAISACSRTPTPDTNPAGPSKPTAGNEQKPPVAGVQPPATPKTKLILQGILKGHTESVDSVAFSPDGKTLASGSLDKTVRLWDVASRKPTKTFPEMGEGRHGVRSVAFSPDGKSLASGEHYSGASIRDLETGELTVLDKVPPSRAAFVAFSPNGKIIAVRFNANQVALFDVPGGEEIIKFAITETDHNPTGAGGRMVEFSPDGKFLATAGPDHAGRVWTVPGGKLLHTLEHTSTVRAVAFSPDGKTIATGGGNDKTIKLWDVETGKNLATYDQYNFVLSLAFSPDGKLLAAGDGSDRVFLWDVTTGTTVAEVKAQEAYKSVMSVAFSPDGKTLAAGSTDKTISLWTVGGAK